MKLLVNHCPVALKSLALLTLIASANDVVFGATPATKPSRSGIVVQSVKATDEITSAQSAVSLIELIKQRLRTLPQLAVNNTKQAIAFQSQEAEQRPLISADPHLLIKPKDIQIVDAAASLNKRGVILRSAGSLQNVVAKSPLSDELDIALVPPTIVSGIPTISLGSSAKEARQSASALGRIIKQHFDDWTVWSVYKVAEEGEANKNIGLSESQTGDADSCRLQVFMQAGMVEALRVFDDSLLRPNLGIALGDDLALIKQRFGEPAFILAEPNQKISQNYIYPINQIGFQLERLKNENAPRIVSVLIFNAR